MKKSTKILKAALVTAFVMCLLILCACGSKTLKVTLENNMGYNFSEIYITPTDVNDYGDNLSARGLNDGKTLEIDLEEYKDKTAFDIWLIDEDGDEYDFYDVTLSDGAVIDLFADDGEIFANITPAKGDAKEYVGEFTLLSYDEDVYYDEDISYIVDAWYMDGDLESDCIEFYDDFTFDVVSDDVYFGEYDWDGEYVYLYSEDLTEDLVMVAIDYDTLYIDSEELYFVRESACE